jgi:hypothetical protein
MAPGKRSAGYHGQADRTHNYKLAANKPFRWNAFQRNGRIRLDREMARARSMDQYVPQYVPWLLILVGILVIAAVMIYWRISYVESD